MRQILLVHYNHQVGLILLHCSANLSFDRENILFAGACGAAGLAILVAAQSRAVRHSCPLAVDSCPGQLVCRHLPCFSIMSMLVAGERSVMQ